MLQGQIQLIDPFFQYRILSDYTDSGGGQHLELAGCRMIRDQLQAGKIGGRVGLNARPGETGGFIRTAAKRNLYPHFANVAPINHHLIEHDQTVWPNEGKAVLQYTLGSQVEHLPVDGRAGQG